MDGTQGPEPERNLEADTAANMAQLCLAGEIVHGASSTVTDCHDQTMPIISVATGGQWFDNKSLRQPWQNYTSEATATRHVSVVGSGQCIEYGPHKMLLGRQSGHYTDHEPLEADMTATISHRTVDTRRRGEMAKVRGMVSFSRMSCLCDSSKWWLRKWNISRSMFLEKNWRKYFDFNYYHYQPGSNNIIVFCKHITHAHAHTLARTTITIQVVAARWVGAPNDDEVHAPFSPFHWR